MTKRIFMLAALLACGCASATSPGPRSYLELPVHASGALPTDPYVWSGEHEGKRLVVVGVIHSRDPEAMAFSPIEEIARELRPELVLQESTPFQSQDTTRAHAIVRGGSVGFSSWVARQHAAALLSGDMSEADEFEALLAHFTPAEVVVFLTGQRFLGGYNPDSAALAREYPGFFEGYLAANGVPAGDWGTWEGFLRHYREITGHDFTASAWDPDLVSPIRDLGPLNELSRRAHRIRDCHLVAAIDEGLRSHDRVLVIFGGWHVLAIEPLLDGILARAARGGARYACD